MSEMILVVEDDPVALRVTQDVLEAAGYRTVGAQNGREGLRRLYEARPDLVILDIILPDMDGWEVCRRIREITSVPIIFVTSRGRTEDRVKGLRMGADDYLVKPFAPAELEARVEAVLRRARLAPAKKPSLLRFANGELVIDTQARRVVVRGQEVSLTPTEYRLLLFLAEHAGEVLAIETIGAEVWPDEKASSSENIRWHVWRLRQKIEADPEKPAFILTARGVGYQFRGS